MDKKDINGHMKWGGGRKRKKIRKRHYIEINLCTKKIKILYSMFSSNRKGLDVVLYFMPCLILTRYIIVFIYLFIYIASVCARVRVCDDRAICHFMRVQVMPTVIIHA